MSARTSGRRQQLREPHSVFAKYSLAELPPLKSDEAIALMRETLMPLEGARLTFVSDLQPPIASRLGKPDLALHIARLTYVVGPGKAQISVHDTPLGGVVVYHPQSAIIDHPGNPPTPQVFVGDADSIRQVKRHLSETTSPQEMDSYVARLYKRGHMRIVISTNMNLRQDHLARIISAIRGGGEDNSRSKEENVYYITFDTPDLVVAESLLKQNNIPVKTIRLTPIEKPPYPEIKDLRDEANRKILYALIKS